MGADLLTFFQRFELLAFFAGYPLLYTLIKLTSTIRRPATWFDWQKYAALPGITYALLGTLFLLFLIWRAFPSGNIAIFALRGWGVTAILFWIPRLRKFPVFCLLHSLVFFGLIVRDIIRDLSTLSGRDLIHNDMTILSLSFLLNSTVFLSMFLVFLVRRSTGRRPGV